MPVLTSFIPSFSAPSTAEYKLIKLPGANTILSLNRSFNFSAILVGNGTAHSAANVPKI